MVSVSTAPGVATVDPGRLDENTAEPRWPVLCRLEKTAIGVRQSDGVTTVRRREPAGCLLFGPYWQLAAGTYRLNFRCRSGKPRMPSEPVLGVEVIAMNRIQLAWRDLTSEELRGESGSLEFSVPAVLGLGAGDEARLEFRFFHLGNADLAIIDVDLHGAGMAAPGCVSAGVWRLLGRLEKTAIGVRNEEGITVRQQEEAGCLLEGGRPHLQLPKGQYRLDFRCAAGLPRMASQPVLGVEVVVWRRWRDSRSGNWGSLLGAPPRNEAQRAWRDFTAMELDSGSTSIDFTVPAELSYEAGEEVLFGFRFLHLANADLNIGAVDLCLVAPEEAAPATPREWRLLGRLTNGTIGTRAADGITVRQAEPAKRLLYGGRPDLRLPSGRYRLSFRCRAGSPRIASQPVLGVEIVARTTRGLGAGLRGRRSLFNRRSRLETRQDFSAEALQTGVAMVEFDVPAELSRESQEHVGFEFGFRHLGNADLAISEVNLHEIVGAEPFLPPALRPAAPDRTSIVIIGNCQAQTVYEALMRTREFNTRVEAKYHFVGLQQNLHELGKNELETCDVMLVQDIRDWESYPLRQYVRDDKPIIKFPLLHFASLWPFDHYNGPGDKDAYEREWPNLTFLYLDGLLARLRKEIPDREQRLSAYRSLGIDGVTNYVRLHDFEKRRLLAMDKEFGFTIGKFILDNFRKKRLFYTTNHPNGQIISMLLHYLLKHLGIDGGPRQVASLDHLNRLQVPVHPKVAKALGVRWASENTKYLYGGEQITWETYIRRYIEHYG